jgi:hypothetical protein
MERYYPRFLTNDQLNYILFHTSPISFHTSPFIILLLIHDRFDNIVMNRPVVKR